MYELGTAPHPVTVYREGHTKGYMGIAKIGHKLQLPLNELSTMLRKISGLLRVPFFGIRFGSGERQRS